jgi:hypothetical protein
MRRTLSSLLLVLCGCSSQVAELDDLVVNAEACDNSSAPVRGTDLDLQFDGMTPHVNQDVFFAVTVGERRNIEAMMVLGGLEDPDLRLVVPKLLPAGQSELAFWADSAPAGFDPIREGDDVGNIDHQWTRPICPNGVMRFEHDLPFQSVQNAVSTGAIFHFVLPPELRTTVLRTHRMWLTVTQLDDDDPEQLVQTRVFFRWSPRVEDSATGDTPVDERVPEKFQIGGNALGEPRGAIDKLSLYRIEFVIDADDNGETSNEDFVCLYDRKRAPDEMEWKFTPDLGDCDVPDGFDLNSFPSIVPPEEDDEDGGVE